ncbi:putative Enoyl reductase (ER) domain-containing protein [Seiridium cardinale]
MESNKTLIIKKFTLYELVPGVHLVVEGRKLDIKAQPPPGGIVVQNSHCHLTHIKGAKSNYLQVRENMRPYQRSFCGERDSFLCLHRASTSGPQFSLMYWDIGAFGIRELLRVRPRTTSGQDNAGLGGQWRRGTDRRADGENVWYESRREHGQPRESYLRCRELGFDGAWNYKAEPTADALTRLAPEGLDVYYKIVGGEQLETSFTRMKDFGTIVASGMALQMNFPNKQKYGARTLVNIIHKRLAMHGFVCLDKHLLDKYIPAFATDTLTWIAEGKIKAREEVVSVMDNTPASCTRQDAQGR